MEILVRTPHVQADEDLIHREIQQTLARFADRLTRVEAYLRDENAGKGGLDMRCVIEARPRGLDPVTAEHLAAEAHEAVTGAVRKLERVLETRFGKLEERR